MKKRNTTIESLRIICMFLLIMHHMVLHGGMLNFTTGINRSIAYMFIPVGKIAFCCFLAISMYFLTNQEFRMEKFLKLWFLVLFYNTIFTILAMSISNEFSLRTLFASFFPVTGNSHGFISAYMAFYLTIPFLNIIRKNINGRQLKFLVIILFVFQIVTKTMGSITNYYQELYSELTLFVFCYFVSVYIKEGQRRKVPSFILILIVAGTYLSRIMVDYIVPNGRVLKTIYQLVACNLMDESGIFNILAGYSLFYLFCKLKSTNSKCVEFIAGSALPVLLIHDHNVFRSVIWSKIFKVDTWCQSKNMFFFMCGVSILIYTFGMFMEEIRKHSIEKLLIRNDKIKKYCERIDNVLNAKRE